MTVSDYDDVLFALADAKIGFVITGGGAIALHGYERPIADLDIVIDPAPANVDATALCMARLGFYASLPLPLSAVLVMRMFDAARREVDVNRMYPVKFAELIAQAHVVSREGRDIPIVSREHLIAVKTARGRDYDLTDLRLLQEDPPVSPVTPPPTSPR